MVLLWDFYNTIAFRKGGWSGCILELTEEYGYDGVTIEQIRPIMGTGFPWHDPQIPHSIFFEGMHWWEKMELHFENVFIRLGVNPVDAPIMSKKVKAKYGDIIQWEIFDDAIETLETSSGKGFRHYIVSNYDPGLADFIEQIGLSKYFEKIYSSAHIGYEKPNPKFFEYVLDDAKLDPSGAIMIGDNYQADIMGAKEIGIKGILVHAENSNNYALYSKNLKGIFNFL